jgi:hypothetical protein
VRNGWGAHAVAVRNELRSMGCIGILFGNADWHSRARRLLFLAERLRQYS